MPRVLRRSKRRKHGYTDEHIEQLLTGFTISCTRGFGPIHKGIGLDEMKLAWQELRDELLREWIRDHPGSRPWAWWRFDAPERRQRTDGIQHPFEDRVRKKLIEDSGSDWLRTTGYELCYGRPRLMSSREECAAQYESELQYLDRLGLLTDEERKELL